ncbi:MFS transporter [Simiduia sp. 21SJ11W-1]|uniref:MFS transporter n=1 Tax=Simiduia sp. 21SJ11W-1 TaxID=2909669 RepID=UPI00209CE56C|nr:MFS transporter [Simiduia sp. 21SJ11W-1]UTA47385.1 MFS transporter [Simiduia sp. 21SJ11W-1]
MNPPFERRAVLPLAGLYVFRMLGLFMVLPVLSLYGQDYAGATPLLLGLALGVYGASQALLQIPFGYLSDKLGRKPMIALGLVLFGVGSVVAALADSVYGLIAGRFLQGCGAIASVIMALVADVTAEENRTKAMAIIGASIGASFVLALILGPLLAASVGMAGLFWATAGLALAGLWLLWAQVPQAPQVMRPKDMAWGPVLQNLELWRLNFGIFALHFVLMAAFIALPRYLELQGWARDQHGWVYLPVMVFSFLAMLPFMILGERSGQVKWVFVGAIALLCAVQFTLYAFAGSAVTLVLALFAFFMAFNLLEATLPSWVSKVAAPELKGTATGIYSTWQFSGAFLGGAAGGWVLQNMGMQAVFGICALVLLVWLLVALFHVPPAKPVRFSVRLPSGDHGQLQKLAQLRGVSQVTWVDSDHVALVQVDARNFNTALLARYEWWPAEAARP